MRRPLLLHIGMSKTGTTAIQWLLAGQREALLSQGAYYPASPRSGSHALLAALAAADPRAAANFHPAIWEGMTPAARLARYRAEFAAEMQALPDRAERCIMSAEQFSIMLRSPEALRRLGDLLAPHFSPVTVLIYLRRQDQHYASAYSQWLRDGVLVEPGFRDEGPVAAGEYDYAALLARFAAVFGEAQMRPRIFDRTLLREGDVIADFCGEAEIALSPEPDPLMPSNAGLSAAGQRLVLEAGRRLARQSAEDWRGTPQWLHFIAAADQALAGRGWQPTRQEAAAFLERFRETNEVVRARYFPERETLFPMDLADLPTETTWADDADLAAAGISLALAQAQSGAEREAAAAMAQFRLHRDLGDKAAMRAVLLRAIRFAPDLLPARVQMAMLCLEAGEMDTAREHAVAALRTAPGNKAATRLLRLATKESSFSEEKEAKRLSHSSP